jgi:hypothetical protein
MAVATTTSSSMATRFRVATAVPADAQHIHYGLGQTEADLRLEPGPHTLRLQFADGAHRSYGSQVHTLIHVNVARSPTRVLRPPRPKRQRQRLPPSSCGLGGQRLPA